MKVYVRVIIYSSINNFLNCVKNLKININSEIGMFILFIVVIKISKDYLMKRTLYPNVLTSSYKRYSKHRFTRA